MLAVGRNHIFEKRILIAGPIPLRKDLHLAEAVEAGLLRPAANGRDGDTTFAHQAPVIEHIFGGSPPIADVEGEKAAGSRPARACRQTVIPLTPAALNFSRLVSRGHGLVVIV